VTDGLCVSTCLGELFINEISMHTPAWDVLDPLVLLLPPLSVGDNVRIGGTPGRLAYPMEVDQTDYSLPMVISGTVDRFGNPDGDGVYACFYRNLQYLRANIYGPVDGVTATWTSRIDFDWGDTAVPAQGVQVLNIEPSLHVREFTRATLELRVPDGEFTLVP
jgi:hypothetical protein